MTITLPPLMGPLRALPWRLRAPALNDLPADPATTLECWTGATTRDARTLDGWPVWWAFANGTVTMIYEHHMFVSIALVENVSEDLLGDVVGALLRAAIDLSAREPVALADLL
ncbi:MAG: hypothetical protein ACKV2T_22435 [Kofleriaceae bacterium]